MGDIDWLECVPFEGPESQWPTGMAHLPPGISVLERFNLFRQIYIQARTKAYHSKAFSTIHRFSHLHLTDNSTGNQAGDLYHTDLKSLFCF